MKKLAWLLWVILLTGCGGGGSSGGPNPRLPFRVVSTTPANHQTGIPITNAIQVTFDPEVDPATVVNGITARSFIDDLPIPGTVTCDPSSKTATFTPEVPLAPLTEYTVTIGTNVKSSDNQVLSAQYTSRFTTESAFWALDLTTDDLYLMPAAKVGEGAHCYIYLENGKTVSQSRVDALKNQFDGVIYPRIVANFGSEPNPGADGLSKVFIVLMDIRDGYVPGGGYVAGYYSNLDEMPNVSTYPFGYPSNQKEIIFMDISPGNPSGTSFYPIVAHEFQHMVHWEQKANLLGLYDDTWLDEAMSEVAPYFAGYGPSYDRVYTYESENNRTDSLTTWNGDLKDYAVAYMWAQYMADRFPSDVFKNILTAPDTGIASVNDYLNTAYPGTTFSSVFRDWSIAVISGKDLSWANHPEWSYKTISTWGTYDGFPLPDIANSSNLNVTQLPGLAPWSIGIYWYLPGSANPTFTWNPGGSPAPQASFTGFSTGGLSFDMVPGQPYPYDTEAVLVLQNVGESATTFSSAVNLSVQSAPSTSMSPSRKLKAVAESETSNRAMATGEPVWVCVHDYLADKEKVLRRRYKEKRRAR